MSSKLAYIAALVLLAGCVAPLSRGSKRRAERAATSSAEAPEQTERAKSGGQPEPDALPEGDPIEEGPIAVPAGDFWMGDDASDKTHGPKRKITLDAFEIDRYEVTAEQYNECVAKKSCTPAREGGKCSGGDRQKAQHPITCVTWTQAKTYCESIGRRLPTEAEWERAARGSDGRAFVWGDAWPPPANAANLSDLTAKKAIPWINAIEGYDDGYADSAPSGTYKAVSPAGASDMAGNVMEWTQDYWTDKIAKAPAKNPKGPARAEERVVRGSSYGHYRKQEVSVTYRAGYREDVSSEHLGFRCAK